MWRFGWRDAFQYTLLRTIYGLERTSRRSQSFQCGNAQKGEPQSLGDADLSQHKTLSSAGKTEFMKLSCLYHITKEIFDVNHFCFCKYNKNNNWLLVSEQKTQVFHHSTRVFLYHLTINIFFISDVLLHRCLSAQTGHLAKFMALSMIPPHLEVMKIPTQFNKMCSYSVFP